MGGHGSKGLLLGLYVVRVPPEIGRLRETEDRVAFRPKTLCQAAHERVWVVEQQHAEQEVRVPAVHLPFDIHTEPLDAVDEAFPVQVAELPLLQPVRPCGRSRKWGALPLAPGLQELRQAVVAVADIVENGVVGAVHLGVDDRSGDVKLVPSGREIHGAPVDVLVPEGLVQRARGCLHPPSRFRHLAARPGEALCLAAPEVEHGQETHPRRSRCRAPLAEQLQVPLVRGARQPAELGQECVHADGPHLPHRGSRVSAGHVSRPHLLMPDPLVARVGSRCGHRLSPRQPARQCDARGGHSPNYGAVPHLRGPPGPGTGPGFRGESPGAAPERVFGRGDGYSTPRCHRQPEEGPGHDQVRCTLQITHA